MVQFTRFYLKTHNFLQFHMYNKDIVIIHMKGVQMSSLVDYKNKNGIIYVYQNVSTWNKQTKRPNTQKPVLVKEILLLMRLYIIRNI